MIAERHSKAEENESSNEKHTQRSCSRISPAMPRTSFPGHNCANGLLRDRLAGAWEEKKLDSPEVQLRLRERSSLESLSAILFQVKLVPARIERVAMRNIRKPQGICLTAHPVGCNRPELHGHTKLPPLNQNQVKSSS